MSVLGKRMVKKPVLSVRVVSVTYKADVYRRVWVRVSDEVNNAIQLFTAFFGSKETLSQCSP